MTDGEFLDWIYNRLVQVHGENELYDYMHRLRSICDKMRKPYDPESTPIGAYPCPNCMIMRGTNPYPCPGCGHNPCRSKS